MTSSRRRCFNPWNAHLFWPNCNYRLSMWCSCSFVSRQIWQVVHFLWFSDYLCEKQTLLQPPEEDLLAGRFKRPTGQISEVLRPREDPGTEPGHTGKIIAWLVWEYYSVAQNSWRRWVGRGRPWHLFITCCLCNKDPGKWQKMDGGIYIPTVSLRDGEELSDSGGKVKLLLLYIKSSHLGTSQVRYSRYVLPGGGPRLYPKHADWLHLSAPPPGDWKQAGVEEEVWAMWV